MDDFVANVVGSVIEHGSRAVRVFPPPSQVLIAFADRLASEVVHTFTPSGYSLLISMVGFLGW